MADDGINGMDMGLHINNLHFRMHEHEPPGPEIEEGAEEDVDNNNDGMPDTL